MLDEADRLLNLDFEEEIDMILKVIPKERTSFLFSATMTSKVRTNTNKVYAIRSLAVVWFILNRWQNYNVLLYAIL